MDGWIPIVKHMLRVVICGFLGRSGYRKAHFWHVEQFNHVLLLTVVV